MPPKSKQTPENVLAAVRLDAKNIKYVAERLITPELCFEVIRSQKGKAASDDILLRWVPEQFRFYQLCLLAVSLNGNNLEFVPKHLIDKEICMVAFDNGCDLSHLPKRYLNKNICIEAVNRGNSLRLVPKQFITEDMCRVAVKNNYIDLQYVPVKFIAVPEEWDDLAEPSVINAISKFNVRQSNPSILYRSSIIEFIEGIPEGLRNRRNIVDLLIQTFGRFINRASVSLFNSDNAEHIEASLDIIKQEKENKKISISAEKTISNTVPNEVTIENIKPKALILSSDDPKNIINIYYISDIHIEHQLKELTADGEISEAELDSFISKKINEMLPREINNTAYLLVAGDVSHTKELTRKFYSKLHDEWRYRAWCGGSIIAVLGNHELWDDHPFMEFPTRRSVNEIITDYQKMFFSIDTVGRSVLLENALFIRYKGGPYECKVKGLTEKVILQSSVDELRELLRKCSFIVLGGIGFSGLNPKFNATMGLYRSTMTSLNEDISRSRRFKTVYDKVMSAASDLRVVILTHTPVNNWSTESYNPNWIYINGHTHHNELIRDREGLTVLSDNQIGYEPKKWKLKVCKVSGLYDPFRFYDDGIYIISSDQYQDFNRGRGIPSDGCNWPGTLYCLKKKGDYLFLLLSAKSLCLMEGGKRKSLSRSPTIESVQYYYDYMDQYADIVRAATTPYQNMLNALSKEVKKIGGNGTVHGCIVDIDFFNHIYVNPLDGKFTPYYAPDITCRKSYSNVEVLLAAELPKLMTTYKNAKKQGLLPLLSGDNSLLLKGKSKEIAKSTWSVGTDMYSASHVMKSIQYLLDNHVIRNWDDSYIVPREEMYDLMQLALTETSSVSETEKKLITAPDSITKVKSDSLPKKKVKARNSSHKERFVGLKKMLNCGMYATCIEYIDCEHLTIEFEDGTIKKNVRSDKFIDGNVGYPKS